MSHFFTPWVVYMMSSYITPKKVIFKICHRIFVFIYRPLFWSVIKIYIFMERQRFYVTIWSRKNELLIFINITSPITTSPKILVQNELINFVVCNAIKLDSNRKIFACIFSIHIAAGPILWRNFLFWSPVFSRTKGCFISFVVMVSLPFDANQKIMHISRDYFSTGHTLIFG